MREIKREDGMLVVEATIVFPVMFLVIFFMAFVGNAYVQKCKIDYLVNDCAINGAAYCADPMLKQVEESSVPGTEKDINVQPYRYLLGGMEDIKAELQRDIDNKIARLGTGWFMGMEPKSPDVDVVFNNGFVYSTFSVSAVYKIGMPVAMLGEERMEVEYSSQVEIPVSDTPEFIRNVNMVEDYLEVTGVKEKISEAIGKAKEFIGF